MIRRFYGISTAGGGIKRKLTENRERPAKYDCIKKTIKVHNLFIIC
jgi:hypothetical protein